MRKLQIIAILLLTAYTAGIAYFCFKQPGSVAQFQIWDKALHAGAYLGFAVLSAPAVLKRSHYVYLLVFWFFFGIAVEVGQGYVGYRDASWHDQLANTVGLALGYLLILCLQRLSQHTFSQE